MQTVLSQLNSIPGVVGSVLCDARGNVLADRLPQPYDDGVLRALAGALADGATGMGLVAGSVKLIDLRYREARIVLKPVHAGILLVICAKGMNLHFLAPSLAVVAGKLTQIQESTPSQALPLPPPSGPAAGAITDGQSVARSPDGSIPAAEPEPSVTLSLLARGVTKGKQGAGPRRSGVAPPTQGLEELRRRLGAGTDKPR